MTGFVVQGHKCEYAVKYFEINTIISKSIGSPPSNERFDYFSNFHEYKP